MDEAWGPTEAARLRETIRQLNDAEEPDWKWRDLIAWHREIKNAKPGTIEQRVRHLKFLAGEGRDDPPLPVRIHGSREEIVESFWRFWAARRQATDRDSWHSTLKNDKKAITWLGKFLGIPENVWPTPPPEPDTFEELPPPGEIRQLIQTDHVSKATRGRGAIENELVKGVLVATILFGLRPGEVWKLRVHDFNPDRHSLRVREEKKARGSTRMLSIRPRWLCCGTSMPSLANWLTWRAKFEPGTDRMFERPGDPWPSKPRFWDWVRDQIPCAEGERFGWWKPKFGRTWSVNARLIEWGFDYDRVANWHGHEDTDTTRRDYERAAEYHEDVYGDNWLIRAVQRTATDSCPEDDGSLHPSPGEYDGPVGIRKRVCP